MSNLTWKDLELGNIVTSPGSAKSHKTGDWRSDVPSKRYEDCIKCGMCWLYCPEGSIMIKDDGMFDFELYHCKGCGICAEECPKKCITMSEEGEA